jgi:predicted amidohydrolase YtcJ
MLNSAAIRLLGLDRRGETLPDGVERDPLGRASGRIYRQDDWLRDRIGEDTSPDLARVGARLARHGVTAMGDATPTNGPDELDRLSRAIASGALPQRLLVMGTHALPVAEHPRVMRGHVKLVLDERELPELDALIASIERAHASARGVAIHCVTRAELVMAAVALAAAGCTDGDRIEHASVAPPELVALLASLPVAIVTQPNFIFERGDAYLQDVEPGDRPWLYRCRGFIDAGIALAAGTDAPFGEADPWATMRAAVDRRSAAGVSLGRDEALDPDEALALFTAPLQSPGQYTPAPGVGRTADLCLLDRPWSKARDTLDSDAVTATILDGSVIWRAT